MKLSGCICESTYKNWQATERRPTVRNITVHDRTMVTNIAMVTHTYMNIWIYNILQRDSVRVKKVVSASLLVNAVRVQLVYGKRGSLARVNREVD